MQSIESAHSFGKAVGGAYKVFIRFMTDGFPRMLYHFHHKQNVKKPRSVHATYLITGTTRPTPAISAKGPQSLVQDQVEFQSSPFPSSLPNPEPIVDMDLDGSEPMEENIPVTTIMLVKEEELEGVC